MKGIMGTMRSKMKVVFWVIAVSFGGGLFIVGAGDFTRSLHADSIALVAGEKVPRSLYLQRLRQESERRAESAGEAPLEDENADKAMREEVLKDSFKEVLLKAQARDLGLAAGRDQVVAAVRSERAFRDAQGHFSPDTYRSLLARQNMTESMFEDQLAESMTLNRLAETFTDLTPFSDMEIRAEWGRRHRKVLAGWVLLAREDYLEKTGIPEADLKEYFKLHADELGVPPEAEVRHILSALAQDAKEADVAAAKASLEALKVRIEKKEISFQEAAKGLSMDPQTGANGGSMGWLKKNETLPDFGPIFDLEIKKVSNPVRTRYGFHLFYVENKRGGKKAEYAGSRKAILEKMAGQEAQQMAKDAAVKLAKAAKTSPLKAAAAGLKLKFVEASFVLSEGPKGFKTAGGFLDACGDLKPGETSEPLPIPEGLLVATILQQTYPQPKPEELAKDIQALAAAVRRAKGGAVLDSLSTGLVDDAQARGEVKMYSKPGDY